MKTGIHEALLKFIDFIYALVFAFIVRQSFDDLMRGDRLPLPERISRLLLLAALFYFLAWDLILGRILTLRNPYKSYTRFFFEILIAVSAYGTATMAMQGSLSFLVYFAVVLVLGALWAWRTARQLTCPRDAQELCVIRSLQSIGMGVTLVFYLGWRKESGSLISPALVAVVVPYVWFFICFYELMVPRYRGISAGPGVPFLPRPTIRKLRRYLIAHLDEI